jgi:Domain of unknown function (DUF3846)
MTRCLVVQPDGTGELADLFELDDYRKAIGGGFMQSLRGGMCYAICDEDGKTLGLPCNALATTLAMKLGYEEVPPDFLAGTVIFHGGVSEDRTVDVSEPVIDVARAIGIYV